MWVTYLSHHLRAASHHAQLQEAGVTTTESGTPHDEMWALEGCTKCLPLGLLEYFNPQLWSPHNPLCSLGCLCDSGTRCSRGGLATATRSTSS